MTLRSTRRALSAIAVGITALLVAGCGSSSDSSSTDHSSMDMPGMATTAGMQTTTTTNHDEHSNMSSPTSSGMNMENVGTVNGLSSVADGYRLVVKKSTLPKGKASVFSFHITDKAGMTVTKFGLDQTKRMHLIVASKDLSEYQHVHPVMAKDGTWSIPLTLPAGGGYRAFADFNAGGKRHVLGATIKAPGTMKAMPLPALSTTAQTDGYTVTMTAGKLMPGKTESVKFTVTRDGQPVTDLQPYLGALGHLVVLRAGKLEYLHVHPTSEKGSGPDITFDIDLETAGRYRAFLQFQTAGTVHTAAFTLKTS